MPTRREAIAITGKAILAVLAGKTLAGCINPEVTPQAENPIKASTIKRPDPPTKEWLEWDNNTGRLATEQLAIKVLAGNLNQGQEVGFRLIRTRIINGTEEYGHVAFVSQENTASPVTEFTPAVKFRRVVTVNDATGVKTYRWQAENKDVQSGYEDFMTFDLGKTLISADPATAENQINTIVKSQANWGGLDLKISNLSQRKEVTLKVNSSSGLQQVFIFGGSVAAQEVTPTATKAATARPEATATNKPSPTATETQKPSPTPEPTKASMPEGMEALGATAQKMVFNSNNGRWEYLGESMKSSAVAYWDTESKRLELVEGIDTLAIAEDKGLFVKLDAATVEEMVVTSGYTEIPIPLDTDRGIMHESGSPGYLTSVVIEGAEGSALLAPFGGRVEVISASVWGVKYEKLIFNITGKEGTQVWFSTLYEGELPLDVAVGQTITTVGQDKLPYIEPYCKESVLRVGSQKVDTTFDSFLTDGLGRMVMIESN